MKTILSHILAAWAAFFTLLAASLAAPGDVDTGFNPKNTGSYSYSGIAMQTDGKILGGGFGTILSFPFFGRINADGTPDTTCVAAVDGAVNSVAVQADGKILIGGDLTIGFATVDGVLRNGIARLNADGTLDTGFVTNLGSVCSVDSMAVQADGKILIAGLFQTVNGVARRYIARLNADGTLDTSFDPILDGTVSSMAVQTDGKIVIVGKFSSVGGVVRAGIARLNANGMLDTGFDPSSFTHNFAGGTFKTTAVQADGKILIGGDFTTVVGGVARSGIARLNADGTHDTLFDPNLDISGPTIFSMAVQADGKIVIAGLFTTVGGVARNSIARLNADGTLDTGFDANPSSPGGNVIVNNIAAQADGKIVIRGSFGSVGGVYPYDITRLENDASTQSLTAPSASRVQWLRGGASPETQQVSFELSTDGGGMYTPLGFGTRIAGGWELTGLSLPASGQIRARARTTGGYLNDSTGLLETVVVFGAALSTNASLASLTPSAGALNPIFASGTLNYTDSVPNATTTITVTPTVEDSGATVTVNGTTVASGTASGAIALAVGPNPAIQIVVTAQDGTTTATYKLVVTRAGPPGADANLSSLVPGTGTLSPAFATGTTGYTASVSNATASMTVTPTVEDTTAKVYVRVNALPYALVTSGAASRPLPLAVGANAINVLVVAHNGTRKTYTVIVTRQQAPVVVVSSPASGATLPPVSAAGAVPALGLAKDDVGVAQVSLVLNGVALPNATLVAGAKPTDWVHWNASVMPENGLNVLTAQSEDVQGNFSVPRTAYFRYVVNRPALAGYYTGLATPAGAVGAVTPPARQVGLGRVSVLSTGAFTGSLTLGGSPLPVPLAATFGNAGDARFWVNGAASSTLEIKRPGLPSLFLALNLDVSGATQQITGTLSESAPNGTVVSNLTLNRLLYTAAKKPVVPLMNVPSSLLGAYTGIFQAIPAPNNGLAATAYPQGDGWSLVSVYPNGIVTVAGRLADGQPISYANYLSQANVLPLYLMPYTGTGSVSGLVTFDPTQAQTDANGSNLLWFKPANSRDYAYTGGWPNGINVNFLGSKFVSPLLTPLATRKTLLGNPPAATPLTANALLTLSGGLLTGPLSNQLSVNVANMVKVLGAPPAGTPAPKLAVTLYGNGLFTGSFTDTTSGRPASAVGVVFQKSGSSQPAGGYFLDSPAPVKPATVPAPGSWQSGAVTISPQ